MDTTRDIIYRDFKLNDSETSWDPEDGIGKGIAGCIIDDFDPDDVDVVQFAEKRAETDGMDVGDPFLGGRRIRISGVVFGKTRALCFDALWQLRRALSPTLAAREEPLDKGYRPLYFTVPTNDVENFPSGVIEMRALTMPKAFRAPINRDQHGGTDADALAIMWSVVMIMKDPTFESLEPFDVPFTDTAVVTGATANAGTNFITKTAHGLVAGDRIYMTGLTGGVGLASNTAYYVIASGLGANDFRVSTTAGGSQVDITTNYSNISYARFATITGNFLNRGTYPSPLNMIFAVGPTAGLITVAAGGSNFTITIPASTGTRIIRVKGAQRIITVEENDVEQLRRSWLTFTNATTWAQVPPGESGYTVTIHGVTLDPGTTDGSHMWFWEGYA